MASERAARRAARPAPARRPVSQLRGPLPRDAIGRRLRRGAAARRARFWPRRARRRGNATQPVRPCDLQRGKQSSGGASRCASARPLCVCCAARLAPARLRAPAGLPGGCRVRARACAAARSAQAGSGALVATAVLTKSDARSTGLGHQSCVSRAPRAEARTLASLLNPNTPPTSQWLAPSRRLGACASPRAPAPRGATDARRPAPPAARAPAARPRASSWPPRRPASPRRPPAA